MNGAVGLGDGEGLDPLKSAPVRTLAALFQVPVIVTLSIIEETMEATTTLENPEGFAFAFDLKVTNKYEMR